MKIRFDLKAGGRFVCFLLAFLIVLISGETTAYSASVPCDNGGSGGPTVPPKDQPPNNPTPNTPDPINVNACDEQRQIDDLTVWGSVGQQPLTWSRFAHTRTTPGKNWFGEGHNWRHSYEWEMADTNANVATGQPQVNINYPDGGTYTFAQLSSTQWSSQVGCPDILSQSGNDFYLLRHDGCVYHFVYTPASGSTPDHYLMTDITDNQGAITTVTYDAHNRVSQITEPGGRSLTVKYELLSQNPGAYTTLATITAQPASGQYTEVDLPGNTTVYRYLRYLSADQGYCDVAEVQFYDSSNNLITGTPFGSGPAAASGTDYSKAFDGDPTTYVDQTDSSGGYAAIDLGASASQAVTKILYYPRTGYESRMIVAQPSVQAAGRFQGSNTTVGSVTVISEVDCSDGRKVVYNYQTFTDPTAGYTYQTLASVTYDDGTQATYTYSQIQPSTPPLITAFVDPRYASGPMARSRNQYFSDFSNVFGAVQYQKSYDTSNTVTTLGVANNNVHEPSATYGWGGTESYVIPSTGFPTTVIDCLGHTTTYTYDANHYMNGMTDNIGRTTSYVNSAMGNFLQVTLPDSTTRVWTRDSHDFPLTYTDELGRVTTYTRDSAHRITQITYPDSTTQSFTYNAFGQVLTNTLRNGGVETYTYDSTGLLQTKVDAVGKTWTYTYDSYSRMTSLTDPNGNTTSYQYNLRGLITQITYADSSTKTFTYDQYGKKLTETNELGNTTTYTYDQYQRLVTITDPLNRTTQQIYRNTDYFTQPSQIILPSGKTTTFTYDADWNKTGQTIGYGTADAASSSWGYDGVNRCILFTDALNNLWRTTWDVRDRKTSYEDPLGNTTHWSYDSVGNILTITRPDGGVTTNTFNAVNQLLTSTDPKSETTTNSYDSAGRLESVTDANGHVYGYGYDNLNRKTVFTYPDSSTETWSYDGAGNINQFKARNSITESFTYDVRNRQLTSTWSDSTPGVTFTYDNAGRVLTQINSNSALSYTYDVANQELTETQAITGAPATYTVTYAYDQDGNRSTLTYPSSTVINYTYTNRNQLSSLASGTTPWASYTYDVNGNRTLKTMGNTDRVLYTYDKDNRVLTLHNDTSGTYVLAGYTYVYNSVGGRTSRAETVSGTTVTQSYAYDSVDQLTSVGYGSSRTQTFTYDGVGNRTQSTDSASGTPTTSYSVNNLNQYTSVGGGSLSYDSNANTTVYGNYTYTYDSKNRLIQGQQSSNLETIAYDPKNRVVSRTFNSVTTYYVYDGWNLAEEYSSSGTLQNRYIHGPQTDEMVARYSASNGILYYHQDALGSVVALSSSSGGSGGILERYLYDAYGNATITNASGTTLMASAYGNRFLYTGREWISELGVYDYRNRIYSASLGRFLQTDPIRFEGGDINIYRYVRNLVTVFGDALGLNGPPPPAPGPPALSPNQQMNADASTDPDSGASFSASLNSSSANADALVAQAAAMSDSQAEASVQGGPPAPADPDAPPANNSGAPSFQAPPSEGLGISSGSGNEGTGNMGDAMPNTNGSYQNGAGQAPTAIVASHNF